MSFIFKVQPEAGALIAGDLTALWLTTLHPAAAAEHQSSDPPPCREGVRYAVTHPLKRCSSFIFCPTPSRIKQLSSSDPTWVREKATYGLSTLCTSARMMGGQEWEVDLFSQRHPDKDGDWEGIRDPGFAASSLSRFCIFFFFCVCVFFIFLFFYYHFPACVRDREMFAELLCGAVALVLYVNTLGADFCYDDRYLGWMNDMKPHVRHCPPPHLITCVLSGLDNR